VNSFRSSTLKERLAAKAEALKAVKEEAAESGEFEEVLEDSPVASPVATQGRSRSSSGLGSDLGSELWLGFRVGLWLGVLGVEAREIQVPAQTIFFKSNPNPYTFNPDRTAP